MKRGVMDYISIAQDHIAEIYPKIVYGQPRLMDLPPGAIIGNFHYSVPGHVRFILVREIELAPGVLPGDLSRAWIRDAYKLPLKRRKDQLVQESNLPLHARLGKYPMLSYVDMTKAYVQILRLGYDLEYKRGSYLVADPRPVPDQVVANKLAYSMAITMSGNPRANLEVMGKEGTFERHPLNIYSNPCLFNLKNDTFNAIGAEMLLVLKDNCVYINTDGYILKGGYEKFALDIVSSWGFQARIKSKNGILLQGPGEVRGVASYSINGYRTERWDVAATDFTSPLMSVEEVRWLKTRWAKWNSMIGVMNDD
jgi:hypothetical protein